MGSGPEKGGLEDRKREEGEDRKERRGERKERRRGEGEEGESIKHVNAVYVSSRERCRLRDPYLPVRSSYIKMPSDQ